MCTEPFEEVTGSAKRTLGLEDMASSPGCVLCLISETVSDAFDPYLLKWHTSWLNVSMSQLHPSSDFLGVCNACIIICQTN